ERWAAIKKFNQHEYQFWQKLTEIANLKHKLLYLNYKYFPIRKSKKCKRSNNTSYRQRPLLAADIIKSTEIRSNKNIKLLQIQETNNAYALSDNNNSSNLSIELPSYSYFIPIFHESFIPYYFLSEYRQSVAASNM
ncbi:6229_t:CDS:1, partial [Racocetra persica]